MLMRAEVKELKARVRNVIDPSRDLGHTDRALKKGKEEESASAGLDQASGGTKQGAGEECEDCK